MSNLTEQLQAQIEQEAKDYAQKRCDDFEGKKHLHRKTFLMYAHQEGAKGYASLWQEAEQRIKVLEQWKKDATALLDPLLTWGQAQKDMPLGCDITKEILRRAQMFEEAEQRAERYEKALKEIADHIKKCQNESIFVNEMAIALIIAEALTHKTNANDTK